MLSAVVFDIGYDSRMIKTRKNMVTVPLLADIKIKNFARHRLLKNIKIGEAHYHI